MARGRMVSRSICASKQVNDLSTDLCRLAFTWAIALLDRNGCLYGDPCIVKSMVFPRRVDITAEHMDAMIDEWVAADLVQRYTVAGDVYLHFPNFRKHQTGLHADREGDSGIPIPQCPESESGPTPDLVRTYSGFTPLEGKLREEKRREGTTKPESKQEYAKNVTLKPSEYEKLKADYGDKHTKAAIAKLSAYKLEKGKHYKSDYGAILSWAMRAVLEKGGYAMPTNKETPRCPCGQPVWTGSERGLCMACERKATDAEGGEA